MKDRESYEAGYRDGESSASVDWDFALTDGPLGLRDGLEIGPWRFSEALAAILSDEQKRALEAALTTRDDPPRL